MSRLFNIPAWICLPSLLCAAQLAVADSDSETARQLRESGDILPLETILQKIQITHPGKVLEVELEKKQARLIYEIEILDAQGKVWQLQVDPRTGTMLDKHEDD